MYFGIRDDGQYPVAPYVAFLNATEARVEGSGSVLFVGQDNGRTADCRFMNIIGCQGWEGVATAGQGVLTLASSNFANARLYFGCVYVTDMVGVASLTGCHFRNISENLYFDSTSAGSFSVMECYFDGYMPTSGVAYNVLYSNKEATSATLLTLDLLSIACPPSPVPTNSNAPFRSPTPAATPTPPLSATMWVAPTPSAVQSPSVCSVALNGETYDSNKDNTTWPPVVAQLCIQVTNCLFLQVHNYAGGLNGGAVCAQVSGSANLDATVFTDCCVYSPSGRGGGAYLAATSTWAVLKISRTCGAGCYTDAGQLFCLVNWFAPVLEEFAAYRCAGTEAPYRSSGAVTFSTQGAQHNGTAPACELGNFTDCAQRSTGYAIYAYSDHGRPSRYEFLTVYGGYGREVLTLQITSSARIVYSNFVMCGQDDGVIWVSSETAQMWLQGCHFLWCQGQRYIDAASRAQFTIVGCAFDGPVPSAASATANVENYYGETLYIPHTEMPCPVTMPPRTLAPLPTGSGIPDPTPTACAAQWAIIGQKVWDRQNSSLPEVETVPCFQVKDSVFSNCVKYQQGEISVETLMGGAIKVESDGAVMIDNSCFQYCETVAPVWWGAAQGGAVWISSEYLSIVRTAGVECKGVSGAFIWVEEPRKPLFDNNAVSGCSGTSGTLYFDYPVPIVDQTNFTNNAVTLSGSSIYVAHDTGETATVRLSTLIGGSGWDLLAIYGKGDLHFQDSNVVNTQQDWGIVYLSTADALASLSSIVFKNIRGDRYLDTSSYGSYNVVNCVFDHAMQTAGISYVHTTGNRVDPSATTGLLTYNYVACPQAAVNPTVSKMASRTLSASATPAATPSFCATDLFDSIIWNDTTRALPIREGAGCLTVRHSLFVRLNVSIGRAAAIEISTTGEVQLENIQFSLVHFLDVWTVEGGVIYANCSQFFAKTLCGHRCSGQRGQFLRVTGGCLAPFVGQLNLMDVGPVSTADAAYTVWLEGDRQDQITPTLGTCNFTEVRSATWSSCCFFAIDWLSETGCDVRYINGVNAVAGDMIGVLGRGTAKFSDSNFKDCRATYGVLQARTEDAVLAVQNVHFVNISRDRYFDASSPGGFSVVNCYFSSAWQWGPMYVVNENNKVNVTEPLVSFTIGGPDCPPWTHAPPTPPSPSALPTAAGKSAGIKALIGIGAAIGGAIVVAVAVFVLLLWRRRRQAAGLGIEEGLTSGDTGVLETVIDYARQKKPKFEDVADPVAESQGAFMDPFAPDP
jgi:hypothetical protein